MKLRRVDICEPVGRFLYGARFGEVAREALSGLLLFLASVWHVCRHVHQSGNRWIRASFRDYGSSIAVRDKDARAGLQCEDTLHCGHIVLEGRLRFLDDADVVAVL